MANATTNEAANETANETALDSRRERYPLRVADVVAVGAFWLLLGIISAVGRRLDPRIPGLASPIVEAVVRATYVEYALWAVLTLGIMWLTSRYSIEGGRRVGRILLFVALGVLIAAFLDGFLFAVRESLLAEARELPFGRGRGRRPPPTFFLERGLLDDLMVYFAVLGAGIARDYFLRYRARLEETALLQAQLVEARLDALRSQLNPHFLFNTLNAVSALVERDPRGARKMIARLSDLLRYTLEGATEAEVTLQKELDMLGEYVELMQIRFQGALDVRISVTDEAKIALVPNLILQPIVENALEHGVSRVKGEGVVEISAARRGDDLVLTVRDNGPGVGNETRTGVGLANTRERLRVLYGDRQRFELSNRQPHGVEAHIALPYEAAAKSAA